MKTTPEQWQAVLKKVYERAATDDAFRARCLSDAKGAIKEIGGEELPANTNVRFVERLEEILLVLPPKRATGGALNDEELEQVAGGAAAGPVTQGHQNNNNSSCVNCSTINTVSWH
jgi:hypothetical protein